MLGATLVGDTDAGIRTDVGIRARVRRIGCRSARIPHRAGTPSPTGLHRRLIVFGMDSVYRCERQFDAMQDRSAGISLGAVAVVHEQQRDSVGIPYPEP